MVAVGKTLKEIILTVQKKRQIESLLGRKLVCESSKCGKELKAGETIISKITHGSNPYRRRRYFHKSCWDAMFF